MRTLPLTATLITQNNNTRAEYVRVSIKDYGGTYRDLSTYPGFNAVTSLSIKEAIDNPHRTCDMTLKREQFDWSVGGLLGDAYANNALGSYAPLIDLNREVKVEVALVAQDTAPVSADWVEVFRGNVDAIDDASGESVSVECRDLGGQIADRQIEVERSYGYGGPAGARIWAPSTAYALNEYVIPANLMGHYYKVTTAGTSAATEPTWPTGSGSTVTNGSAVYTEQGATAMAGIAVHTLIQQLLDDNLGGVTLVVPSAPTWVIKPYQQSRDHLLDAIKALAIQIGWDTRYLWDGSQYQFTFYEPDRTKTDVDMTFTPSMYITMDSLKREKMTIRNAVRVVYSDSATLDPGGNPIRKDVLVTDGTSITKYGRLYMELAEASTSQIDTSTEATTLANAALSDLMEPSATQEVTAYYWPATEMGDLYLFTANDRHYSADQTLAVVGFEDTLQSNGDGGYTCRSKLTCRGKPAVAHRRWLAGVSSGDRFSNADQDARHRLQDFAHLIPMTPSAFQTVGGTNIVTADTFAKLGVSDVHEVHVSTTSGFTPSLSTLKADTRSTQVTVADLNPGTVYYAKVVPKGLNAGRIVRGVPSPEVSFTAGSALSQHISFTASPAILPPNGLFEHAFRDFASLPPDHWSAASGSAWGVSSDLYYGADANGGRAAVLRPTANICRLQSDMFAVIPESYFNLDVTYKTAGTPSGGHGPGFTTFQVCVDFFQDSAGTTPSIAPTTTLTIGTGVTGTWLVRNSRAQPIPSDGPFARMRLEKSFADSLLTVNVDGVVMSRWDIGQQGFIEPAMAGTWVDFGASDEVFGYMKDSFNFVHLKGLMKNGGAAPSTIYTLPAGYRPAFRQLFIVNQNDAAGSVTVSSAGVIAYTAGLTPGWVSLAGLTYKAA